MSEQPLVSVVSSLFQSRRYIPEFLCGLLAQTYPRIELLLVDDGSDDGLSGEVERFLPALRSRFERVEFERTANRGGKRQIQGLVSRARGELFLWHDADDFIARRN